VLCSITRQRLAWLATCVLFVACASSPAPVATKKKKRKKKRDDTELVEKKKKSPKKHDDDEVVVVVDEDEAPRKKPAAKDEDAEPVADKKRKKKDNDDSEQVADNKRKKKQNDDSEQVADNKRKKKQNDDSEQVAEPADKPKRKKPQAVAAAAEKPKPKKQEAEPVADKPARDEADAEPVAIDMTGDAEARPAKKVKHGKQAKPAAPPPDEGAVIEMTGDEDEEPERRVAAIPVPGVDSATDEAPLEDKPVAPEGTPLSINDRPLTRGKGKLAAHGGLRVNVLTLPGAMPGLPSTTTTSESLTLGAAYGVSDDYEIGLDYALGIDPGTVKGPLTMHGAYSVVRQPKLDVALAGGIAVDFSDLTDPVTMQTTTRTSFSLQFGAWARYRLSRKASLFSGVPATPAPPISLSKLSFALPPLPYQLAIGLNNAGTVALDLPVGGGYQVTPKIYALAMLNLAHIRISNTANAFLFKDFIPFVLGGFYALDKIDVGLVFSDDLDQGTDYLRLDAVVRYSIQ
jgi:hypothetical protein